MRGQNCVRYRTRRDVEACLSAMAVIRAARTVMVTLLHSPGRANCPVCNGSGFEGPIETTLPHSDFGDPDCCGCLNGVIRGDQADIVCNECGTVLRTVHATNVGQTLTELEITLEVASEMCPHCGSVNLFPGLFQNARVHLSAVRKGRSASGVVSLACRASAGHGLQKTEWRLVQVAPPQTLAGWKVSPEKLEARRITARKNRMPKHRMRG